MAAGQSEAIAISEVSVASAAQFLTAIKNAKISVINLSDEYNNGEKLLNNDD